MINNEKYTELLHYLQQLGRVVVAFSGGVDSTFLLRAAKEALGEENVKAITIATPYIPRWELDEAKVFAKEMGIAFERMEFPLPEAIKNNPEDRCYLCKKAVFTTLKAAALAGGFSHVVDGTNLDDLGDYRPGLRALAELEIKSPLRDCRLTKADIRQLSQQLRLPTWDKPSYACLLTRIPYGQELKAEDFIKIEQAERYLMQLGFRAVRVRLHGTLARIEVPAPQRRELFDEQLLTQISSQLKAFGFHYVTLDLEGYRTGSFNEALPMAGGDDR